jgi:hypothetical protein
MLRLSIEEEAFMNKRYGVIYYDDENTDLLFGSSPDINDITDHGGSVSCKNVEEAKVVAKDMDIELLEIERY